MAKEKATNDSSQAEKDKFKAIQDILMGGEMRQIEQRFHKLQERLEEAQTDLEKQFVSLKKDLTESQASNSAELNKKIDSLIEQLTEKVERNHKYSREEVARIDMEKANRKELGKMFLMIGESLLKDED
ncbi:MAG: hypothetical protein AAF927_20560 [Bacteroidota bacterium]